MKKRKRSIENDSFDSNSPFYGPLKLIDELVANQKPHDIMLLPGSNHTMKGTVRRDFWKRVAAYFKEHL
ncbi:MAG: prolyl oligopeptidase family serine peptidase [Pseudomonadota bacterium]